MLFSNLISCQNLPSDSDFNKIGFSHMSKAKLNNTQTLLKTMIIMTADNKPSFREKLTGSIADFKILWMTACLFTIKSVYEHIIAKVDQLTVPSILAILIFGIAVTIENIIFGRWFEGRKKKSQEAPGRFQAKLGFYWVFCAFIAALWIYYFESKTFF